MSAQNLLVEIFVEELPPKALLKLGEAFAAGLYNQLQSQGLLAESSEAKAFASPRRLAAHITNVMVKAPDKLVQQKLMPVSIGLTPDGRPTPALLKKLQSLGVDIADQQQAVNSLQRSGEANAQVLFYDNRVSGVDLANGLQHALDDTLDKLPIPKVMQYQLEKDCELPGWSSVHFVRPAHSLLALHGSTVVPVKVLGLTSGQTTQGHRFEARKSPVTIQTADGYADTLLKDGSVIASFAERRDEIHRQLKIAAEKIGGGVKPIEDKALLDEVTALVERPNVLICEFDKQFLDVPQECLILTMKANQKYFPILDSSGRLTNQFLVVSNISPVDSSAVITGNERVVRPRLADAKFFFDQDRKKTLESRVDGLSKVVYHNKLGSQGDRMKRVCQLAEIIGHAIGGDELVKQAATAARLAKTDLLTDMVGEFPELQGVMGAYYARHDQLSNDIALAIEDHYKPRFAGDELPRNEVGLVVALADKLETLVGLFGIGQLPTGDKDPFALRRHALGLIRMLMEQHLPIDINQLLKQAVSVFGDLIKDPTSELIGFIQDRLAVNLREAGCSPQEVDAVLALAPSRLADIPKRLHAVRDFAKLPQAAALIAANKRIGNILKKAQEVDAHVSEVLLQESAEKALFKAMQAILPKADKQFEAGELSESLQTLAGLRETVDNFFNEVMVNAEQLDLRLNRQGLLKSLHRAMNRVADLSRLGS